jgi:hypothetical protein
MRKHPLWVASIGTLSVGVGIYVALMIYAEHLQSIGLNLFG